MFVVIIRETSFRTSGLFYCLPSLEQLCLPWCLVDVFICLERSVAFVTDSTLYTQLANMLFVVILFVAIAAIKVRSVLARVINVIVIVQCYIMCGTGIAPGVGVTMWRPVSVGCFLHLQFMILMV